jgi:hypothetical protein
MDLADLLDQDTDDVTEKSLHERPRDRVLAAATPLDTYCESCEDILDML